MAVCVAITASHGVVAADTGDVQHCRSIRGEGERLACYDRALPPIQEPVAAQNTAMSPATSRFGLSVARQRAADPTLRRNDADRMDATIRELRRLRSGMFVVTLDNNQLWQQTEVNSRAWPDVGDHVVIRQGALGSYLLITPSEAATRVRRLK